MIVTNDFWLRGIEWCSVVVWWLEACRFDSTLSLNPKGLPSKLLRKHWIDKHILINIINKIWLFVFSFSYIYCKWYIEVSHSARITFDIIREFLFCKCCFFYTTKFSGNKCKCLHFAPPLLISHTDTRFSQQSNYISAEQLNTPIAALHEHISH